MGVLAVGDVVAVEFPYSNYLKYKKRPALIIGLADFDNYIICQITSKDLASQSAITLRNTDFIEGGLRINSYIRPDKIYTVEAFIIDRSVGKVSTKIMAEVRRRLAQLLGLV
ncbi:type II toxin-antitoxin system PemK/MazF family toxin [Candidatus Saccharibacteria bacterium]|nr:type II toxin-antitoxin system PemK/MazF family toxin [Candidatus Saccharibacteria bacterium]